MRVYVIIGIDDRYRMVVKGIYSTMNRAKEELKVLEATDKNGYYYIDEDEVQT